MTTTVPFPPEACFYGVATMMIFCRPECPSRPPREENVRFFAGAADAEAEGYRACKRCRPDRAI